MGLEREARGGLLSGESMTATFLPYCAPTRHAMNSVVLNKIDPVYIVSVMLSYALCQHYTIPPYSFFRFTGISHKGRGFQLIFPGVSPSTNCQYVLTDHHTATGLSLGGGSEP